MICFEALSFPEMRQESPVFVPEGVVSQEKTEAVVLRGVDFSETSRIVTFLTPDRGRMACMAKGVRRRRSAFAGVLDTFNRVELVYYWKDGRQVQTLAEATLLDGFPAIKRDPARGVYAGFPLELVYRAAHENEPSRGLYEALTAGLSALCAWSHDVRTHACWQALRLIGAAGFAPEMEVCVRCGKTLGDAAGFALDGGLCCLGCRPDRRIAQATQAALRAMSAAATACPVLDAPKELVLLLRDYAARHLETDFRSVRVALEMFG